MSQSEVTMPSVYQRERLEERRAAGAAPSPQGDEQGPMRPDDPQWDHALHATERIRLRDCIAACSAEAAPSPQPGPRLAWRRLGGCMIHAKIGSLTLGMTELNNGRWRFDCNYPPLCSKAKGPFTESEALSWAERRLRELFGQGLAALSAPAPAPMPLERAVEILNERRHKGFSEWKAQREPLWEGAIGSGDAFYGALTVFEAIALAEKYERDAPAPAQEGARDEQ